MRNERRKMDGERGGEREKGRKRERERELYIQVVIHTS